MNPLKSLAIFIAQLIGVIITIPVILGSFAYLMITNGRPPKN